MWTREQLSAQPLHSLSALGRGTPRARGAAVFLSLISSLVLAQPTVAQSAGTPDSSRVGLVLNAGPEVLVPIEGGEPARLGVRLGGGVRVGLMDREEEGHSTVPALAFVGGFLGHDDRGVFVPGGFLEVRPEIVVAKRAGLLQPSLVAYGIGGAMVRGDGVVPYFGLGLGWDLPMFAFDDAPVGGSGGGWNLGNLGSGAALLPAALIVAAAIIGFVLIGRVELRYYPLQMKGGPAMTAILIGFGF